MRLFTFAASLFLVACTVDNPNYRPTTLDAGADLSGKPSDMSGPKQPDLSTPPGCASGPRVCLASGASASCMGGGYVIDRKCPTGSTCSDGFCSPPAQGTFPPQGMGCTGNVGGGGGNNPNENICIFVNQAYSCQPFILSGALDWVCAAAVGTGTPGTTCTVGADCRTGFCGDNGTCFRGCNNDSDCPNTGQTLTCQTVNITVEGQTISAKSCVP
jgi:hypothetical protein